MSKRTQSPKLVLLCTDELGYYHEKFKDFVQWRLSSGIDWKTSFKVPKNRTNIKSFCQISKFINYSNKTHEKLPDTWFLPSSNHIKLKLIQTCTYKGTHSAVLPFEQLCDLEIVLVLNWFEQVRVKSGLY